MRRGNLKSLLPSSIVSSREWVPGGRLIWRHAGIIPGCQRWALHPHEPDRESDIDSAITDHRDARQYAGVGAEHVHKRERRFSWRNLGRNRVQHSRIGLISNYQWANELVRWQQHRKLDRTNAFYATASGQLSSRNYGNRASYARRLRAKRPTTSSVSEFGASSHSSSECDGQPVVPGPQR